MARLALEQGLLVVAAEPPGFRDLLLVVAERGLRLLTLLEVAGFPLVGVVEFPREEG